MSIEFGSLCSTGASEHMLALAGGNMVSNV